MDERRSIYVETTIFSYLTARPSKNIVAAAWQQITHEWWMEHRRRFDLYISELVVAEAERGDSEAAARRLAQLKAIPLLSITEEAISFADKLVAHAALPLKAADDALHIAVAAVHGISYLLTWNCRHIDNAEAKPLIRSVCNDYEYVCPEICTPSELMGDSDNE